MTESSLLLLEQPSMESVAVEPAVQQQQMSPNTLPCVHCGEPTVCAATAVAEEVFCCRGCSAAYQLIHGWGLDDFYALRAQMSVRGAAQAASDGARYEQFDSEAFLGASAPSRNASGVCTAELAIHGLHCAACAWLIENAAAHEPGLLSARVRMSQHTIRLVFDPETTRLSQIARFLDRLGYRIAPFDPSRENQTHLENRRWLVQIAVAGFLAANAMWIAIALYAGEFSGVAQEHRYFLGLVGTGLGLAAVLGPGRTFFIGARAAIASRTPHMDLPVALGLGVGSIAGAVNALLGSGHVYFDSLATLVFLLLIGRWIQFRQQQRAARAVDLMLRITPRHAVLENADGSRAPTLVDRLTPGDMIYVAAGESIAADGEIISGHSSLDHSLLTGESVPQKAFPGDAVAAGVINLTAPIRVRVTATGRGTRIGQVMQSVESAALERTPIVMLADRIGGYFVLAVTLLALIAFASWLQAGWFAATSVATALLIVACPCALALATPLAIAVALGRAAQRGVLIRDGGALQHLARPGAIWLDKTGTLTEGRQRVTTLNGTEHGLQLAAALEAHCNHPAAQAIEREAQLRGLSPLPLATDLNVQRGGVMGCVAGQRVCVGNRDMIEQSGTKLTEQQMAEMKRLARGGESPILVTVDGRLVTLLGTSDPLRAGAGALVHRLRELGWKVGILSGDHPAIVERVGRQLGLSSSVCCGGRTPEEKLKAIEESRAAGHCVAMVGDGANDAAALARADIGIAVRGGAEASLQAAPIFVSTGRLDSLIDLMIGARRTRRLILLTFAVSLAYNLTAVALAMTGTITPLLAALLMPLSSLSVLAITLLNNPFAEVQA